MRNMLDAYTEETGIDVFFTEDKDLFAYFEGYLSKYTPFGPANTVIEEGSHAND